MASLDRIIPPDESVPLRGSTFLNWENQVAQMRGSVLPVVAWKSACAVAIGGISR